jgi:hypothetical protein
LIYLDDIIIFSQTIEEHFMSFREKFNKCLMNALNIMTTNFKKPFFILCDASNYGIGAILCQNDENGEEYDIHILL